jgi:hypothetical protein
MLGCFEVCSCFNLTFNSFGLPSQFVHSPSSVLNERQDYALLKAETMLLCFGFVRIISGNECQLRHPTQLRLQSVGEQEPGRSVSRPSEAGAVQRRQARGWNRVSGRTTHLQAAQHVLRHVPDGLPLVWAVWVRLVFLHLPLLLFLASLHSTMFLCRGRVEAGRRFYSQLRCRGRAAQRCPAHQVPLALASEARCGISRRHRRPSESTRAASLARPLLLFHPIPYLHPLVLHRFNPALYQFAPLPSTRTCYSPLSSESPRSLALPSPASSLPLPTP